MRRRTFLTVSGSSLCAFSGCLNRVRKSTDQIRVPQIALLNGSQSPESIDLVVTNEDEILHWQNYELPAATDHEGYDKILKDMYAEPGRYTFFAKVDPGRTAKLTTSWILERYGRSITSPPPIEVEFHIRTDGILSKDFERL